MVCCGARGQCWWVGRGVAVMPEGDEADRLREALAAYELADVALGRGGRVEE